MPWHVAKSSSCPVSKPFAVIKDADGRIVGCHPSEAAATRQLAALYAQEHLNRGVPMNDLLRKTLTAQSTTITDQGVFSAILAAWSVDRMNEKIDPHAFDTTIAAWQASGKNIPLHWDHEGRAADIVGYIDPKSMMPLETGLYVEGKVDIDDSDAAREVWRSMKNNAVGLSFGYLVKRDLAPLKDGEPRQLLELDLFEGTITPAPVNADTRVLETKGLDGDSKAVWSAAYVNSLPDSSFLYIEPGGKKDDEGKTTPRSLRHFPVKDANGTVDLAHVRNALARIPQSNVAQSVKDRCTAAAQRMLAAARSLTAASELPVKPPESELRRVSGELALENALGRASDDGPELEPREEDDPVAVQAALNNKAFAIAYRIYPEGIPHSVTQEIISDPKGWLEDNKGRSSQIALKKAFEIAGRLYPGGVPHSITQEIVADPQTWIDENRNRPSPAELKRASKQAALEAALGRDPAAVPEGANSDEEGSDPEGEQSGNGVPKAPARKAGRVEVDIDISDDAKERFRALYQTLNVEPPDEVKSLIGWDSQSKGNASVEGNGDGQPSAEKGGIEGGGAEEPEPGQRSSRDSLRQRADSLRLERALGRPIQDGPALEPDPEPAPEPADQRSLRRKADELALELALGGGSNE